MSLWALGPGYVSRDDERAEKRVDKKKLRDAVYAAVDKRDGMICRACGCRMVRTLARVLNRREHHHILPLSLGGADETANVVNVCLDDHQHVTRHRLTVTGSADGTLTFSTERKTWTSDPPRR